MTAIEIYESWFNGVFSDARAELVKMDSEEIGQLLNEAGETFGFQETFRFAMFVAKTLADK